jgi:hypothetical protein
MRGIRAVLAVLIVGGMTVLAMLLAFVPTARAANCLGPSTGHNLPLLWGVLVGVLAVLTWSLLVPTPVRMPEAVVYGVALLPIAAVFYVAIRFFPRDGVSDTIDEAIAECGRSGGVIQLMGVSLLAPVVGVVVAGLVLKSRKTVLRVVLSVLCALLAWVPSVYIALLLSPVPLWRL